ncbi:hypothetical protein [Mycobacterium sp. NAZ190054]|uniref:hypothetical protein n=1 Tax=Mycobacterium sp. NAZ190054 TaxID=1747766 RepID=UPI00350FDEF4
MRGPGEALLLAMTGRVGAVALIGAIPLLNALFPGLGSITVFGVRLNWLVLAALVYPLLYGIGWFYVRLAEQAERDFVGVVDSEP